jgi:hypothetical protein
LNAVACFATTTRKNLQPFNLMVCQYDHWVQLKWLQLFVVVAAAKPAIPFCMAFT